jgi:DNA-binding response OmpR family regulator
MKGRLLIVDDEESILFSMHDYFTGHGWKVDCARTMDEAKSLAAVHEHDIVITDLHLTGFHVAEGLELVTFLRERGTAKVIVLSAYGTDEIEQVALQRGADAFVQKTMPISEIAQLLARLTE